ncbi:MAG: hypothetical protein IKQ39_05055 [Oscillospiraceae bacterium]|nr:hypothetical protein [Oscillospiraceae bacterium]
MLRLFSAGAALLLPLSVLTACGTGSDSFTSGLHGPGSSTAQTTAASVLTQQTSVPVQEETLPQSSTSALPEAGTVTGIGTVTTVPAPAPVHQETLPELVHCSAKEIIGKMGGRYQLFQDEASGYFYFTNDSVYPNTRFYVCDTAYEDVAYSDSFGGKEQEIRRMLTESGILIDKINTYAGGIAIDGYEAGKYYSDYAAALRGKDFSFGNYGEYFCGAPASSAYSYTVSACKAEITLHFELTGDYMQKEKLVMSSGRYGSDIMEKDNPQLGLITVERADGYPKAHFTAATASSVLAPYVGADGTHTYEAANVLDGKLNTCWSEGVDGLGYGETITLHAAEPQVISSITVYGGLRTDERKFLRNAKPTRLRARFDDGSVYTVWVSDDFSSECYPVFLCSGKKTSSIELSLYEITAGTACEDTCISEIRFE